MYGYKKTIYKKLDSLCSAQKEQNEVNERIRAILTRMGEKIDRLLIDDTNHIPEKINILTTRQLKNEVDISLLKKEIQLKND